MHFELISTGGSIMSTRLKFTVSILLLFAMFIPFIPGCRPAKAADGYTAVIPAVMQTGASQAISVALFSGEETTSGKVNLAFIQDGKTVYEVTDKVQGNDQLKFELPALSEGDYTVRLTGDSFSDETKIKVENKFLVFAETDKPIYKPGQTMHMRVITLNGDLLPLTETVTVEVVDAKGIKVYRSEVTTDDYG
ncbi:MAG: hypothetical protein EHM12_07180, partial [Dehalococcoidia bacterium]